MSFTETVNSLMQDSLDCDLMMQKCIIFSESSIREYGINCKEAELKVIKESGTQDDLNVLIEAANEGLIQRIKKTLQKAAKALSDFIKNIIDKVKTTFASKKAKDTIDQMEKLAKTNPKLKNAKIQTYDVEKEQKCIQKGIDKLYAKLAKLKSGHVSKTDDEDINNIKEECQKERAKILAATAAVTLTVAGAIALYKKYLDQIDGDGGEAIKEAKKAADDIDISDALDDETLNKIQKIKLSQLTLSKEKLSSIVTAVTTFYNKLKGQTVSENLEVNESVNDNMSDIYNTAISTEVFGESENNEDMSNLYALSDSETLLEAVFNDLESDVLTEGANRDFKKAYKKAKSDYKVSMKKIKALYTSGDTKGAKKEINNARKALKVQQEIIDSIDPSLGSAILSLFIIGIKDCLIWLLPTVLTFGIAFIVPSIKETIEFFSGLINDANNNDITANTFNAIRNRINQSMKLLNKSLDKIEHEIDISETVKAESVDDILDQLEYNILSESENDFDVDHILESLEDTITNIDNDEMTESTTVDEYLENLENELFY